MKIICRYPVDNSPDPDTAADQQLNGRLTFASDPYSSPIAIPRDAPVIWEDPSVSVKRVIYLSAEDDESGRGYRNFRLWGKSLCTFADLYMDCSPVTEDPDYETIPSAELPSMAPVDPNITTYGVPVEIRAAETPPAVGAVNNPYCISFDGVDDYVLIPDLGLENNLTVELWIYVDALPDSFQTIIGNSTGFYIGFDSFGSLCVSDAVLAQRSGALTNFVPGRWNHLAVSYDTAGVPRIYVNGTEDNYGYVSGMGSPGPYIGSTNGGAFLEGKLDEIRIWNYERTAEEIAANMVTRLNGDEEGLVAYWRCDEGTGDALLDSAGGNDGIRYGSSWTEAEISLPPETSDFINLGIDFSSPPYGGDFAVLYYLSWEEIP